MFFKQLLKSLIPSSYLVTEERRDDIRLCCNINVLLQHEGRFQTATVVNVTQNGLCLESESSPSEGELVTLNRDDFGAPVRGKVIWCRSKEGSPLNQIGVGYDEIDAEARVSWLEPALRQCGFNAEFMEQKREFLRAPGRVACKLNGLTGKTYVEGEMLDLSLGGALVESELELHPPLTIEFETFPQGKLPATKGVAKIVSSRLDEKTGKWRCGLSFTESKEDEIREYMKTMLSSTSS